MSGTIELSHQGRSIPRGFLKLVVGVSLITAVVGGSWWLVGAAAGVVGGVLVVLILVPPAFWLVAWGAGMAGDGASDLFARMMTGRTGLGYRMVLGPEGVHYGVIAGQPGRFVPWAAITGSAFRTGPGGSWWFCLDTDLDDPRADEEARQLRTAETTARAPHQVAGRWAARTAAPEADRSMRMMLQNVFWFDTMLAMNSFPHPGGRDVLPGWGNHAGDVS